MVASISSNTVSDWSSALFSKLDTKQQGYIEKSDIEAAFAKTGSAGASGDTSAADQLFAQLDGDQDGKVTKSELSTAIGKLADQLNAQFDQARVARGGGKGPPPAQGAGGPPPGAGAGGAAPAADTSAYNAAADTNNDGTVSADEAAAYAKLLASGAATANQPADAGLTRDQLSEKLQSLDSTDSRHAGALGKLVDNFDKADANGDGKLTRDESRAYLQSTRPERAGAGASGNDAASALAKALQLLKAYVDGNQPDTPSVSVSA